MTRERLRVVGVDSETTGLSLVADEIVELAIVAPSRAESLRFVSRIRPGRPIPKAATAIHKIRDEDVVDAPRFSDPTILAPVRRLYAEPFVLVGYNVRRFDEPLLRRLFFEATGERLRPPLVLDVGDLYAFRYRSARSRKLKDAAARFGVAAPDHSAAADIAATFGVLRALREVYEVAEDLEGDLALYREAYRAGLALDEDYARWDYYLFALGGPVRIGFGKHSGTPLAAFSDLPKSDRDWLLDEVFLYAPEAVRREVLAAGIASARTLRLKESP